MRHLGADLGGEGDQDQHVSELGGQSLCKAVALAL